MLKTISVDQLQPGMYLHALGGPWIDHPFWTSSFLLRRPQDLQRLRDSGIQEVVIDTDRGLDLPSAVATAPAPLAGNGVDVQASSPEVVTPSRVELEGELARAWALCGRAKQTVQTLFQEIRLGRAIDASVVQPLVEDIAASVGRNAGALISLARLKSKDDYTYLHSVTVCALMISLARQLGLDDTAMRAAGAAGLLHDLGKAAIPLDILNKPGKLSDDEFAVIRQHPLHGHESLLRAGVDDMAPLDVCLHHHEKMDGTGYPDHLAGQDISLMARMGAVCDVYDAVTSNRPYKSSWHPGESLKRMAGWSGHFDPEVFQAFVKTVGIYPVGSVVMLASGRLGVVLDQGEDSLLKPRVKVFFSTRSQLPIRPEVVDLSRGTSDRIVGHASIKDWGLPDIDALWTGIPNRRP